jgi:hypothetical protein
VVRPIKEAVTHPDAVATDQVATTH